MNSATPSYLDTITAPKRDEIAWRGLLRHRGERVLGDEANVVQALRSAPELAGLVRFNEFAGRVEFDRKPQWREADQGDPWTDADDLDLQAWLQVRDVEVRLRGIAADSVHRVSLDNPHHPVREYLNNLKWDGEPRLQIWLIEYLNAEGPPDYLAAVGTRALVAAVARIMQPGCQADHTLVLEGAQGIGKSRTVQVLGYPWTTDGLPDLHSKDAAIHLAGVWLVELAELAALRKSEIEPTKAFLTRRVDRYRPPYARRTVDVPRQCVFVATTNERQYLRDPSGNRRFWPVRCASIDLGALERDRPQLWAEAVHQYRNGQAWHLSREETEQAVVEQNVRVLVTELEQAVALYLDGRAEAGDTEVATRDVFRDALGVDPSTDVEKAGRLGAQLAGAMNRAGWQKVTTQGRGKDRRNLYRLVDGNDD